MPPDDRLTPAHPPSPHFTRLSATRTLQPAPKIETTDHHHHVPPVVGYRAVRPPPQLPPELLELRCQHGYWPPSECSKCAENVETFRSAVEFLAELGFTNALRFVENVGTDKVWDAIDALSVAIVGGARLHNPAGFVRSFCTEAAP
jgi:hypothetical protein